MKYYAYHEYCDLYSCLYLSVGLWLAIWGMSHRFRHRRPKHDNNIIIVQGHKEPVTVEG